MGETPDDTMTFQDVLVRLKGRIGRTKLREHLSRVREFHGGPTHRRWGSRIIFYPADYSRLLLSLECPSKSTSAPIQKRSMSVEPSKDRAFTKAQELLTQGRRKSTAPNGRQNSGKKASTANAPL
ncbi:hypothetical protein GCM10007868_13610 [Gluconobacter frateurii]|uniref:Uncharacterized protein n=1 Tax=Gluconobacter frateurii NRIC 0228 TaxID=1307946 RepID=A0ABQ0QE82_9PROT|nr:hypothetical protein AA0228_2489 [Gluconobacter frateurii NRIC 0228]GLP90286.1 hypothetical protein GCM10007868_13610 [Gluconobacter frateurii]